MQILRQAEANRWQADEGGGWEARCGLSAACFPKQGEMEIMLPNKGAGAFKCRDCQIVHRPVGYAVSGPRLL
jgi:hypothetical protein